MEIFSRLAQIGSSHNFLLEIFMTSKKEYFKVVESLAALPQSLDSTYCLFSRLLQSSEYRRIIEKIARKQTRGTALAWEDAAQTAYEKILLAIQSNKFQRGGVAEFYRWSATIAHCTIVDLNRREKARQSTSLDGMLSGSNTPLLDTIADQSNVWEAIEQAELLNKVNISIQTLDAQYPERGYLKLLEAKILGKRQTQIASELNISQGAVSKRWKELIQAIMTTFELLETNTAHPWLQQNLKIDSCDCSIANWHTAL